MAIISEAVFSARLEAFGMEQEHFVKFAERTRTTWVTSQTQQLLHLGQADDTGFIIKLLTPTFGATDHRRRRLATHL